MLTLSLGTGLVNGCAVALAAVGFTLIFNATNVINFANASMLLAGGYGAWQVDSRWDQPFALALIAGVAAGALVGLFIDRVLLKIVRTTDPLAQVIALVAFSTAFTALIIELFGSETVAPEPYAGTTSIVGGFEWSATELILIGATALVIAGMSLALVRSSVGLTVRAAASSRLGASLVGIRPTMVGLGAWIVGGALAALSGVLLFPTTLLSPGSGFTLTFTAFAAVVLGGVGSFTGAVVGGLVIGIAQALVAQYLAAGYEPLVSLVVMLIVLTARPSGLLGDLEAPSRA